MRLHIQFVFGAKNGLPADRDALEFQLAKMRTLLLRCDMDSSRYWPPTSACG